MAKRHSTPLDIAEVSPLESGGPEPEVQEQPDGPGVTALGQSLKLNDPEPKVQEPVGQSDDPGSRVNSLELNDPEPKVQGQPEVQEQSNGPGANDSESKVQEHSGDTESITLDLTGASKEDGKQPAAIELKVGAQENKTPKALNRESIETSMKEKLSRKTDSKGIDPFVPQAQLDNEVVQVAREKGFPLSRGTEIGARLLARSRRTN